MKQQPEDSNLEMMQAWVEEHATYVMALGWPRLAMAADHYSLNPRKWKLDAIQVRHMMARDEAAKRSLPQPGDHDPELAALRADVAARYRMGQEVDEIAAAVDLRSDSVRRVLLLEGLVTSAPDPHPSAVERFLNQPPREL